MDVAKKHNQSLVRQNNTYLKFNYFLLWCLLFLCKSTVAEVVFDGSLGPQISLDGPDFAISDNYGQTSGNNLFHSFSSFNLTSLESATFSGPANIENVIGRITGGSFSSIDGTLRSTIPGADLYLINPMGILFGPNAMLDLQGSLHVSTADYLGFTDGQRFYATIQINEVLSSAPPSAFGFLNSNPEVIIVDQTFLQVPDGETLSIVGGDIIIQGGPSGFLNAYGGDINLISTASSGEVTFSGGNYNVDNVNSFGEILIFDRGILSVSEEDTATSSGSVYIRAGQFTLDNSIISSANFTTNNGDIDIAVTGNINLQNTSEIIASTSIAGSADISVVAEGALSLTGDSGIRTFTEDSGAAGDINASAGNITMIEGSDISSLTAATGNAGNVTIAATNNIAIIGDERTRISSSSSNAIANGGNAGNVDVTAQSLFIDGGWISSVPTTPPGAEPNSGNAGMITIDVNELEARGGAVISTASAGAGLGGDIFINASESIILSESSSVTSATLGDSNGGDIQIQTTNLDMDGDSLISATTHGAGDGGDITITVDNLSLRSSHVTSVAAFNAGASGNITINASSSLALSNPSGDETAISGITTTTIGSGKGGNIDIDTPSLIISNSVVDSSTITSPSDEFFIEGDAGTITINADKLALEKGGSISSSTDSDGTGGEILITVRDSMSMSGTMNSGSNQIPSHVAAGTLGVGNAGNIDITTANLTVDAGFIETNTAASGNAGVININSGQLSFKNGGAVSSGTLGSGIGGSININGADSVSISGFSNDSGNSSGFYSTAFGSGIGGTINIDAKYLNVNSGGTISASSEGSGNSGTININNLNRLDIKSGVIRTLSEISAGGLIEITARDMVYLSDGQITTEANDDGGDINIDPTFVVLDSSQIIADANVGNGGNITITADTYFKSVDSLVSASSNLGEPGVIDVPAPDTDIASGLVSLPSDFLDTNRLLRQRCAIQTESGISTLSNIGRGGLPPDPDFYLMSSVLDIEEVFTSK